MNVVPFKAHHLKSLSLQEQQQYLAQYMTDEQMVAIENGGWGWSGVYPDGFVVGCAGVIPLWQGRGMAWAYLSEAACKMEFLKVHRAVMNFLDSCYLHRIEMTVDCDFEQGHRWARMLGFEMEAERMKGYRPDGGDCALYARVLS